MLITWEAPYPPQKWRKGPGIFADKKYNVAMSGQDTRLQYRTLAFKIMD